jgi:hypothetical protein
VRYPGYYQIHAFIPAVNGTTNSARYQVHHNVNNLTIVPVDQLQVSDDWVSLGQYRLWPQVDYVSLYDYTGETSGSRRITADAMKFSASVVHLPDVKNSGGWVSSIVIRNNSASSAQVAINYYNSSGGYVSDQTATIAGNGSTTKTPPSGFSGSAVVVASQDVSVVVENQADSARERTNYTGILPGGPGSPGWEQAEPTLYAPIIKRQRYGRSSIIHVTNAGAQETTASIYYYNGSGNGRLGNSITLSPNSTVLFLPNDGSGSGGCDAFNTVCSARVYSSNSQPLVGVVQEYDDADGKTVTTHNLFSAGAASIYFPIVKYQRYDMSTGLRIQNVGSVAATITVNFYEKNGSFQCTLPSGSPVPSYAAYTFNLNSSCPGSDFSGSAVATASGQPLVGMANEVSLNGQYKKAYSSFQGGSHTAYGPLVYRNYSSNPTWNAGVVVQNLSSQLATVHLYYYDGNGSPAGSQTNQTIAGRGMSTFSAPQNNFKGSVMITADRDIAVVVNVINDASSGDTHAIYNASGR